MSGASTEDRRSMVQRVTLLIDLGRFEDAVVALTAAGVPFEGSSHEALLLARAHLGTGDVDRVLRVTELALKRDPDQEWGHRLRSIALGRVRRFDAAVAAAQEAARLRPFEPLTHLNLAERLLAADEIGPARAAVHESLRLDPSRPAAHRVLGQIELRAHRLDEARAATLEALRLDPHDASARNQLGIVDLDSGDLDAAQGNFIGAVRLDPAGPGASNADVTRRRASAQARERRRLRGRVLSSILNPLLGWYSVLFWISWKRYPSHPRRRGLCLWDGGIVRASIRIAFTAAGWVAVALGAVYGGIGGAISIGAILWLLGLQLSARVVLPERRGSGRHGSGRHGSGASA